MVTINLLPWREKQARYEKRVLMYVVSGSMACALLMLVCADRYLSVQQQAIMEHIENLKKELIWREGLSHHVLQQNVATPQENPFDFFRRLNETGAREVCFEQIKKSKSGIELIGFARSSEQLTAFLQTSSLTAYFSELKVNRLQQQSGQLKFNLMGK